MNRLMIFGIAAIGTLGCTNMAEVATLEEGVSEYEPDHTDPKDPKTPRDPKDPKDPKPPPPPPPTPVLCRVTGGGQIEAGAQPDSFGGNAQPVRGTVRGQWNHVTHDDGHFHGQPDYIECFTVAGPPADPPPAPANAARFSGTGRFDGEEGCEFTVYVEDHGEPGTQDFYSIEIECPSGRTYSAGDTLLHGNIQIHAVPPGHQPR